MQEGNAALSGSAGSIMVRNKIKIKKDPRKRKSIVSDSGRLTENNVWPDRRDKKKDKELKKPEMIL